MEVGRTVVPLDDGDRPPWPEEFPQRGQSLDRMREVPQDETDEDMVEGLRGERQGEDVRLLELHVGETSRVRLGLSFGNGGCGDVNRDDACARAVAGERYRLGAGTTPGLKDRTAFGVRGVR